MLAAQTFLLVFIAELADKSRLVGLLLVSAFPKHPFSVFGGMTLAYVVLDGGAAFLGGRLPGLVPPRALAAAAGLLFIGFGAAALWLAEEGEAKARALLERGHAWGPFFLSLAAVGLGELGDRTQLATAALAAESGRPWPVLTGALGALAALNVLTVLAGEAVARRVPLKKLQLLGGVLFLLIGAAMLVRAF